ncbi:mitochondrial K+-H+ exchange-related-domain-containing protein [Dichomitus squalens]|uniref:Mitochondrial K+-H+ exchange-related-domain-containing protein n=1 Tax=Dichomitus squalens TaxID=114155 RepID=A0A4Q9M8F6_9APHY|nr:mitochondrial K+-H+ exchange-related-domain-containing protein [Dichomitus squalens]
MRATAVARNATRSMRIIALPLTPHRNPINGKPVEHLTYYHFITPPEDTKTSSWPKWAVAKASDLWAGLGKAPESSWKRKAFLYGERLVDRLDFEELALKSLDPSLGPKISNIVPSSSKTEGPSTIPLVFPTSVSPAPIPHLHSLLERRTPKHRKGFWMWLAISPLTAPFAIIPIIPNFPFFFCIWRSWSHYRAYKASEYLESLLQRGAIITQSSPELDVIYAKYAPRPPKSFESEKPPAPSDHAPSGSEHSEKGVDADPAPTLLLTKEAVVELQKALDVPEDSTFAADVYRALEQARLRLEGKTGAK